MILPGLPGIGPFLGSGGGVSPFAYSTSSGSLTSGSSVDVSLPAGTTFVTAVVYQGVTNSTNQITFRLRSSASAKSATQLQDVNNGGTITANTSSTDLASSQTVASAAEKRGLFLQAGLVRNASYRTYFSSIGGSENENARTAVGMMATAQAEDTLRITTPDTFSSGSYYVLIESGETTHTLSTSSGTLSGSSVSVSIPAGAVRAKVLAWNATLSATAAIQMKLQTSAVDDTFNLNYEVNNGTTIAQFNSALVASSGAPTSGTKSGLAATLRGLGDASVQTVVRSVGYSEDETGRVRQGYADTAQLEDTIILLPSSGTFSGGSYYVIFEGA